MPTFRRPLGLAALASAFVLAPGCGAPDRPSTAPRAPSAPSTAPVATAVASAAAPPALPPAAPPADVRVEPEERHTDEFMVRPRPIIEDLDRKAYCVDSACRGLDAQLAEINRTAKGSVAPACGDVRGRACGARCESVMLGTWSAGKTLTFTEANSGPITHCYDRGGQLVAAHHNRRSGPQFGDSQACFESATPTRALCRPDVLGSSCADGRCLAFSTMLAAVGESAARSADHGCSGVVTPVCGGANPTCRSVKAVTCPDYQTVIAQHAGGAYFYNYTGVGALISTTHTPALDSYQAPHALFGLQGGGTSCSAPARSLCGPL